MLRVDSRNTSFNAVSLINDIIVASFSASINEPGSTAYVSINIDNVDTFRTNIAAVKADLASFVDEVAKDPNEEI